MKELEHISVGLDEVLTNMLTRCMLNPNNKDFYIENLTLEKVKQYFIDMPQDDISVATIFWTAYSRAEAQYLEEQKLLKEYDKAIQEEVEHYIPIDFSGINELIHTCPECGCKDYIEGVKCPNCDYIDEV